MWSTVSFMGIKLKRFWSKVDVRAASDCWDWKASTDTRGYGNFSLNGKTTRAHRLAYALSAGPIPRAPGHHGAVVMHSCDNKKCCNPAHLSLGTHAANMADMKDKGRRKIIGSGIRNGRAKLTHEQVLAIRDDKRGKRVIAAEIGISPAQVQRIRKGLQWNMPIIQTELSSAQP